MPDNPTPPERPQGEPELRLLLWMNHGHVGMYGDDGEMQCAACLPEGKLHDYKREPMDKLLRHVINLWATERDRLIKENGELRDVLKDAVKEMCALEGKALYRHRYREPLLTALTMRQHIDKILKALRKYPDAAPVTPEDAEKIKAFNLLLTAVNPTVRRLAERYLEGVKDTDAFIEFLRTHPLNKEVTDAR